MMSTPAIFDASLLTRPEVTDIAYAIQRLDGLSGEIEMLLGPIPVLDEDGAELVGYLKQGDDMQWRFVAAAAFEPTSSLLPRARTRHPDQYNDYADGDDIA